MIILTFINIAILLVLAIIHLYWAMGGNRGIENAIPTTNEGKPLFEPGKIATLAVALALICFAYFHYGYLHSVDSMKRLTGYFLLAGGALFLLRAIGEFNYTGIFKKIRHTQFAHYDTWIYTPLCILISALTIATYFIA